MGTRLRTCYYLPMSTYSQYSRPIFEPFLDLFDVLLLNTEHPQRDWPSGAQVYSEYIEWCEANLCRPLPKRAFIEAFRARNARYVKPAGKPRALSIRRRTAEPPSLSDLGLSPVPDCLERLCSASPSPSNDVLSMCGACPK